MTLAGEATQPVTRPFFAFSMVFLEPTHPPPRDGHRRLPKSKLERWEMCSSLTLGYPVARGTSYCCRYRPYRQEGRNQRGSCLH